MRAISRQTHTRFNSFAQRRHALPWLACMCHIKHMMNWFLHESQVFVHDGYLGEKPTRLLSPRCWHIKYSFHRIITNVSIHFLMHHFGHRAFQSNGSGPLLAMFFSWPLFLLHPTLNQEHNASPPPPLTQLPHRTSLWTTLIKQAFNDAECNATLGSEQWCD